MDKVRRDKRKEVHARPKRLNVRDRLRYNDQHVLDRLGHRRQSAFDRLSKTYSPSTPKSRPGRTYLRDHPHGRNRPHRLDASNEGRPKDRERFYGVEESYDDSYSHSYHDRDRSRYMKRRRDNESPLSNVLKSDSSDGRYQKSKSKRHKPTDEDDLMMPWIHMIESGTQRITSKFPGGSTGGTDPVEIHNIKQKDEETIEDFMEQFKVETGRMKGAPECKRIFGFMHGVNNPELKKRLNEHVPRTMEEIMITTTAFIRGEAAVASKKKGHTSWRTHDQSKRQTLEKRSDFRGHPREGRGSSRFTPLQGHRNKFLRPRQIEELGRADKLSHLIKEIKHGRDQSKVRKKETPAKDKHAAIYMIQSWQRMTRQKMTQNFKRVREITFPPLTTSSGSEGPLVIEAEIGGHMFHRMLLVTIGDTDHSTRAWMNFMIVRSLSPYNGIIGRPGIKEIQAPSNMTGVPRSVAEHQLNIREGYSPVRQKKRGQAPERAKAIQVEVQKLVEARIMREVYYHDWLSNPVMIQLAESDEEKTAFHTGQGVYCYTKMPFSLKNTGATYQGPVDKAFDNQIGRNIEVYVNDLVVKSHTEAEMLRDIGETFRTLRKINMKLSPKKCTFEAVEGVFLGYMVTPEGIKPCLDKTTAVLQLPSPRIIKEVQSLNGKLPSLNRFLSKSAKKSLSLFKTLKKYIKKSEFHWTSEAKQDFKQLKQHLSKLTLLVAPKPKEELIVYMSASYGAISAVLMTEKRAVQMPVYFVSRALHGLKLNYTPMEKLVLSLFFTTKRLQRRKSTSRISSRNSTRAVDTLYGWIVGARLILTSPEGTEFTYALRFQFAASNNEAEYEALIAGLRIAVQMGVKNVHVNVDSKLVANQVLGTYVAKEENMIKYLEKVKSLEAGKKAPHQGPKVQIIRGGSLQAVIPYTVVKVRQTTPSRKEQTRAWRKGIKARLGEGDKNWVKELPHVLWAHRTMIKSSHDETPFSLTCGTEAVIPAEIRMPTYRTAAVDVVYNDEELRLNLVLLDERRERAAILEAKAKLKMTKYYNARVCGVTFRPGDFVYRSNDTSHVVDGGKLGPKWEAPYEVTEALGDGAYKLRSTDETVLPRTWNITNLKRLIVRTLEYHRIWHDARNRPRGYDIPLGISSSSWHDLRWTQWHPPTVSLP
nr:reverse transcriptase domain-containing protein [Tanacetum cinerariifolium]